MTEEKTETPVGPSLDEVALAVRRERDLVSEAQLVGELRAACAHSPEAAFVHVSSSYEYDDHSGTYLCIGTTELLRADGSQIEDPLDADGGDGLCDFLQDEILWAYGATDLGEWFAWEGDHTEARIPLDTVVDEASIEIGHTEERDGRTWVNVCVALAPARPEVGA